VTGSFALQHGLPVVLQISRFTVAAAGLLGFYMGFVALLGYWVHRDATTHGTKSTAWVFLALMVPFGVVIYLYQRRKWPREQPRTEWDRRVETLLLAATGGFVVGAFFAPPDPFTQVLSMLLVTAALLPVSYLLYYHDGTAALREAL